MVCGTQRLIVSSQTHACSQFRHALLINLAMVIATTMGVSMSCEYMRQFVELSECVNYCVSLQYLPSK